MAESFRTRLLRWKFNFHPAYRRSGARIVYIDETFLDVRLRLPLNRATRNLNGTIYGGSIYSAVDPVHAVMLVSLLGPKDYVVWTKEAHIRFRRQARTDLVARVVLDPAEVADIREEAKRAGRVERHFTVELRDLKGHVCAECDILVHIHARRERTRIDRERGIQHGEKEGTEGHGEKGKRGKIVPVAGGPVRSARLFSSLCSSVSSFSPC